MQQHRMHRVHIRIKQQAFSPHSRTRAHTMQTRRNSNTPGKIHQYDNPMASATSSATSTAVMLVIFKGTVFRLYGVLMSCARVRKMDGPDLSFFNAPIKEVSYTCVKCGKVGKETVCTCGSYAVYATLRTRRAIRGR